MAKSKRKSVSEKILERVLKIIRFKQNNSYENLVKMKNVSKVPAFFFPKAKIECDMSNSYSQWNIISNDQDAYKHILYFHGGAYVTGFSLGHWSFLGELYRKSACNIHTPDYPLAPQTKAEDLLKYIQLLYFDMIEKYGRENMIIMGDSAGAGIALALCQSLEKSQQASDLFLLSPWLDLSMNNPEIDTIDKNDLILNIQGLKDSALAYAGDLDLRNPKVSPLFGNHSSLPPVKIFTGNQDILMPDCRILRDQLISLDKECEYIETENLLHCGMLYPTAEGKSCIKKILQRIGE